MFPETIKQTRKVEVFCAGTSYLVGFRFFDSKSSLICQVGKTGGTMTPVLIDADEQVIGVKAKLLTLGNKQYQDAYADFQLMVCKRSK